MVEKEKYIKCRCFVLCQKVAAGTRQKGTADSACAGREGVNSRELTIAIRDQARESGRRYTPVKGENGCTVICSRNQYGAQHCGLSDERLGNSGYRGFFLRNASKLNPLVVCAHRARDLHILWKRASKQLAHLNFKWVKNFITPQSLRASRALHNTRVKTLKQICGVRAYSSTVKSGDSRTSCGLNDTHNEIQGPPNRPSLLFPGPICSEWQQKTRSRIFTRTARET